MAAERQATDATPYLPPRGERSLPQLASAVRGCEGCELYKEATQVVFGEGPAGASIMLVGEQPGDQEDKEGRPFVGPAGRLLDDALDAAHIARDDVYVTNAVKHFYFTERGKRRLHQKPKIRHLNACVPWLQCELDAVRPRVVVAMGATAGRALLGAAYRVTRDRGKVIEDESARPVVGTIHPSALLRMPTSEARREGLAEFVRDLKVARDLVEGRAE